MIGHITYLSDESMHQKFGRRLQNRERFGYEFETDFARSRAICATKARRSPSASTPIRILSSTKAMDYFDLSPVPDAADGGVHDSASAVKFLVVSFTSDWLYPSYHSRESVSAPTAAGPMSPISIS